MIRPKPFPFCGCKSIALDQMTLSQMDFVTMGEIKMWTKFKHWLIRKLGGYIAPCIKCNEYKRTLIEIARPVEMIRSQYCVDSIGHIDPQVSIELAKAHIFNDLMEGIKDRNYIKYEYEDDGILRGTLMVVKPV